tara:strand:- start:449 stop:682 length:234 start_codon:yes stop_codon:yes gene_type:complete
MDINIAKEIDLLGEICPMTFVKTKLAIEKINQGERIKVTYDSQEAKINVPKSLSEINHQIITIQNIDKEKFYIIIQK